MLAPIPESGRHSEEESQEEGEGERVCCMGSLVKLVDMKAVMGKKMTIAGVRITEKAVHLKAQLGLGLHRLRHTHSEDKEERRDEAADTMAAATEWKLRKEQEAKDRTQWERAMIRGRCEHKMARLKGFDTAQV